MPNWCHNQLTIQGTDDELNAIRDLLEGENEVLDFEQVKPTPRDLEDFVSDTTVKNVNEIKDEDLEWQSHSKPSQEQNLKKHGFASWYEFHIAEWGTKWNACDPSLDDNGDRLIYTFDTAWSPPGPIVLKLSELFPNAEFELKYIELGMSFAGTYSVCNSVESDEMYDYRSKQWDEIALNFGFEDLLEELDKEDLVAKDLTTTQ